MTLPLLDRPGDFIDGRFAPPATPDGELVIASPADLDDRVAVHPHALAQVDAAVDAARRAAPDWRRAPPSARAALLERYRDRVRAHREDIALCIAREAGKPLWEARGEADAMATKVDVMLGEGARFTSDERIDALPGEIRHRPLGVVAVIGPFNFPGHLPNGQIVPALFTGNCVVHKPSERTPSTAVWIARALDEAGAPPGVFNLVQGEGAAGAALCRHRDVDGVLFTGSAAVGRAILADNLDTPGRLVALELGGKNAAIALDDCDLEHTARQLAFAAFASAGQRCTSTSRLYVTPGIADALTARIAGLARGLVVGYPLDDGVFMGPVISEAARERLLEAQRAAVAGGYDAVVAGGSCEVSGHRGFYVRPAVHRAQRGDVAVTGYSDAELFGPDLAVVPVADLDEAVARANDSRYGLAASVYTADTAAFERAADGLRVGVLHHNRSSAGASGRLPFGGLKDSGNHHPAGILAGTACTFAQAVLLPQPDADAAAPPTWPGFEG